MSAFVYRFVDRVAISLPGTGETIYLTAAEARKLARALNAGARSVKEEPQFSTSTFGTVEVDVSDPFRQSP